VKKREVALCLIAAAALSASFLLFSLRRGYILYSGDAAAHLNIARRLTDSRNPGWEQLGTVWLPLPHLLMAPLARYDSWWRNGLAGAIPAAAFFVAGACFLFAAVRRATGSRAAAVTAAAAYALNPNLLYLQSTPMTEPIFLGLVAAAVYFGVRRSAAGAGLALLAATLTRYEAWFLLPFFALFFLAARSWKAAALFLLLASAGPLYWLGHNRYYYSDPLEFYRGPHSAKAIYQRGIERGYARHPGDGDLRTASRYYLHAMELALGRPLVWTSAAGLVLVLLRASTRPLALLALPAPFYILCIHSGGTPLLLPDLYYQSYYNTRYALAALPACAAAAGAVVGVLPRPWLRAPVAAVLLAPGLGGWLLPPTVESWICWKEAEVNSRGRREWTAQAAAFFRQAWRPGDGILTASGDVLAVYQSAGIPLRETTNDSFGPAYLPALHRPDLFLRDRWMVCLAGDPLSFLLSNPRRYAQLAERVATFTADREPVVEIYRKRP
jgi:hypothetical protein